MTTRATPRATTAQVYSYDLKSVLTTTELQALHAFVVEIEHARVDGLTAPRIVRGLVRDALARVDNRSTADNVAVILRATGGR